MRIISTLAAGALTFAAAGAAFAASVPFDDAWKVQRFSLFSGNDYDFNGDTLAVGSDGTVSIAYRPLAEENWSASSASWSWGVDEGVPPTDLSQKGGDDRNLAVYFVFLPEDRAEEMQGVAITSLLNEDDIRALVYVWGGDHERGELLDSPYLGERGKTVVLRPSGTGAHEESVDLAADHEAAFGTQPGALVGVAISGDSDDTETSIDASVSNFVVE